MAVAPLFPMEATIERLRGRMCEEMTDSAARRDAQRILLADDDPDSLEGMRSLLVAWGYEVETAEDGRAALDKVGAIHPSAVITDVVMPEMSGLELLEAVRRDEPGIPVIVLTAHASSDTQRRAVAHGAFAYLPKPVDAAKLKTLLASALGQEGGGAG
jgi:two-component system, NtrC family, response regulator GlrR